ncbi:hypothetical protein GCM10020216_081540 [Nonomuraea helvata]
MVGPEAAASQTAAPEAAALEMAASEVAASEMAAPNPAAPPALQTSLPEAVWALLAAGAAVCSQRPD